MSKFYLTLLVTIIVYETAKASPYNGIAGGDVLHMSLNEVLNLEDNNLIKIDFVSYLSFNRNNLNSFELWSMCKEYWSSKNNGLSISKKLSKANNILNKLRAHEQIHRQNGVNLAYFINKQKQADIDYFIQQLSILCEDLLMQTFQDYKNLVLARIMLYNLLNKL